MEKRPTYSMAELKQLIPLLDSFYEIAILANLIIEDQFCYTKEEQWTIYHGLQIRQFKIRSGHAER